jgi:predicted alpha/beta hydrolase family esterase
VRSTAGMVVIVYGFDGSGPGHWQRWLEAQLEECRVPCVFPELPDPTAPRKDAWVSGLSEIVGASAEPVTFVCHSLGCWAVDHLVSTRGAAGIRAALLVAPPSPFLLFEPVASFFPPPRSTAAWHPIAAQSLLVGSDNDEFTTPEEFEDMARSLGVACRILAGAAHINVESGYGPWPFALDWLQATGEL